MPVALIVAAAGKRQVIGNKGDLPWHYSADLKYFKEVTLGHPVIMGRTTYASIVKRLGRPLPGRQNIVLTRNKSFKDERVSTFNDLKTALASQPAGTTIFVIGGQQIFEQTLPLADKIYLTQIDREYDGDVFFPPLDTHTWRLAKESNATEKGDQLHFREYVRI